MKKLISLVMVVVMLFAFPLNVYADNRSGTQQESVVFEDGKIIEHETIVLGDVTLYITRETFEDNTSILSVEQNGETTTTVHGVNYQALLQALSEGILTQSPTTFDRLSGYTYTYLKTDTYTDYYTPENGTYAAIVSGLGVILGAYDFTLGAIVSIAGIILSSGYSAVDTKLVTTMKWYYVTETATGEFICYYCEYSTRVYSKLDTGAWKYIGEENGTMESLSLW